MICLILKSTTYFKSAFLSVKSLDFRWCTKHFMITSIINLLCEKKKDFIKLFDSNSKINVSLLTARHQCSSLCKWIGTNNFSNEKMSICFVFIKKIIIISTWV